MTFTFPVLLEQNVPRGGLVSTVCTNTSKRMHPQPVLHALLLHPPFLFSLVNEPPGCCFSAHYQQDESLDPADKYELDKKLVLL